MVETTFGIRNYTVSEKTKRPQKSPQDLEKIEKRNSNQQRLYINLQNIDEIFSDQEKYPVCYSLIFNTIQGKVTKYFNTRSFDRKKEVSYDCINRLYSILKRKLLKQRDTVPNPTLFFYLSQFFRYIDLLVYSTVFYDTQDYKFFVQEPEDFKTEEVLASQENQINYNEEPDDDKQEFSLSGYYEENALDKDSSEDIKHCIENNTKLDNKEKSLLLKLYKKAYSQMANLSLTKKEEELLSTIRFRLDYEPELLDNLEEILDAKDSTED